MIPFPNGLFSVGAASKGLIDQLSSTTTIIGAWSINRSLKASTYSAGAMKARSNESGAGTLIPFNGNIINTTILNGVWVSGNKVGVNEILDQSGNGNTMAPQSGTADGVIISTAGAYTNPVTVAGGTSLPMLGVGPGNQSGSTGVAPSLSTAVPMAVSFGAVNKHFMLMICQPQTGAGDVFGRTGGYLHTGDAHTYSTTTSYDYASRDNSTTSGVYNSSGNSANQSFATMSPDGGLHMLGSLCDGTDNTIYIDRSAGTVVAYNETLGSGGSFVVGADPAPNQTSDNWCAFISEILIGTFTNSASAFKSGDWTLMQNNMRAFAGTP